MKLSMALFLMFGFANRLQAQISAEFETDTLTTATFTAASFISDNEGWLADDAGKLWRTSNGGESWTTGTINKSFLQLDFADATNGFGLPSEAAWKTTDGGSTWSALTLPGDVSGSLYFFDANTGFIGGNETLYKTTNGGANWTIITMEGFSFLNYFFTNSTTGIAAVLDADSTRSIMRTTIGGSTWTHVYAEEDFFINSVWLTDENTAWAAGYFASGALGDYPAILRSNDGGVTWKSDYINGATGKRKGERFISIRFKNVLEGYALSANTESVYTTDGGHTWNLIYDESGNCFIPDWGIYQTLEGISDLYLIGKNGYVTKWE
jgi:photosystem II stability/assembly factor-like uncharacterized protein